MRGISPRFRLGPSLDQPQQARLELLSRPATMREDASRAAWNDTRVVEPHQPDLDLSQTSQFQRKRGLRAAL